MKAARVVFAICVVIGAGGCQATKSVGWFLAEALLNGADDDNASYAERSGRRQREEVEAAEAAAKSQAGTQSELE